MTPSPEAPRRIENRIEIHADPWAVYRALTLARNVPDLVPGVRAATAPAPTLHRGDEIDLETLSGRRLRARVLSVEDGLGCTLQDDLGTQSTWMLRPVPGGTLAVHTLTGTFDDEQAPRLQQEALMKLRAFGADVEEDQEMGLVDAPGTPATDW